MNNASDITGTKFESEAVMKLEAASQSFETPPLRSETPPLCAKIRSLFPECQKKRAFPNEEATGETPTAIVSPRTTKNSPLSPKGKWRE